MSTSSTLDNSISTNTLSIDEASSQSLTDRSYIPWAQRIEAYIGSQPQPSAFTWAGRFLNTAGIASTKLAGKLTYKLWFTPQNRPMSDQDTAWLKSAEQNPFAYKTYHLPLYQWGQGKTILLVHGWGGHAGQFRQLAQALIDQGYRVMSFDAPGHGLAEGTTTNAEEISEIIQYLAKEHVFEGIISHSIGGLSSHHALNAGVKVNFHGVLNTPMALLHIVEVFKHQLNLKETLIDEHKRLMEQTFGQGFWNDFDLRKQRYHVKQFFSYDDADHQVIPDVGPFLQDTYPEAHHCPTQGLGHNKGVRNDQVIQAVLEFVKH